MLQFNILKKQIKTLEITLYVIFGYIFLLKHFKILKQVLKKSLKPVLHPNPVGSSYFKVQ